MVLQLYSQIHKFLIALRKVLCQFGDWLWCTDTCNHVLALCVNQVLAVDSLCTGGWVTCKRNTCTGGLALISEYHGLNINSSTPVAGDIVHTAVYDGTWVVPGTEHSLNSAHQLLGRILREILAVHSFLVNSLEFCCQLFQIISSQICIKMYALCFFHLVDDFLEVGLWNFHNNVRIHLDESAVGIVSKSWVAGLLCKSLDCNIV